MATKIEGVTLEKHTYARLAGASVRLEPAEGVEGQVSFFNSNEDGNFSIEIDELNPGLYILTAYHPDSGPNIPRKPVSISKDRMVTVEDQELTGRICLELDPLNIVSNTAGLKFLAIILVMLLSLAGFYMYLHDLYPSQSLPINDKMSKIIEIVKEEAMKVAPELNGIEEKTADARKMFDVLKQAEAIDENTVKIAETLFNDLIVSIQNKNIKDIRSNLNLLDDTLRLEPSYFWQESPLNLLEMLFWATAATLIRLAMNAGRYLKKRDFHRNAIPHHVGYFFAVPVMALLIALVLSFVNVDFKLGASGVSLDFSDVIVSIVVASLVGLAPWRASEFLERLADSFFTKIGGILPKDNGKEPDKTDTIIKSVKAPSEVQSKVSGQMHPEEEMISSPP